MLIPVGAFYMYIKSEGIAVRDIFVPGVPIAHVGEIPIRVEIADTEETRNRGLSYRKDLEGIDGMLFVFDTAERHSMWMKDMNFPIDIIWINESLSVVGIERNVQPDSYPKKFYAPAPARYAIETRDRYTDTFGIGVGNMVRLPVQVTVPVD